MGTLNLGILAHVDAGKTSLTEHLLHAVGVLDHPGRVDDGTTRTDSLLLERQRGITIRSAVVSFRLPGDPEVVVNLVDTPGHPDFIAEVERSLAILDGVVLLVSAVEGVQAQTRVLMRALQRLRLPTLLFVNKVDRAGADVARVIEDVSARLTPVAIPLAWATQQGSAAADVTPYDASDGVFRARLHEVLAERDETLLRDFSDDRDPGWVRLRAALAAQTAEAVVHPLLVGSALTGAGTDLLLDALRELLPTREPDVSGPVRGSVFKVERGPSGERFAFVRLESGSISLRERVRLTGARHEQKVTSLQMFEEGSSVAVPTLPAGRIGRVSGFDSVRVGDRLGGEGSSDGPAEVFAPPSLETVVDTAPEARGDLHLALTQLAEQDPLIGLRRDEVRHETSLSLYGEVQKEVVEATLAGDYGLTVSFHDTTTLCIERVSSTGAALERIQVDDNPFLATVGLSVQPQPTRRDRGVRFELGVELGSMPPAFFAAVRETVHATLDQGLRGWPVHDCVVTMTHAGYWPRQSHAHATFDKAMSSTAGDFRMLTPLVLMAALRRAGTVVCEPVQRFDLDVPADTLGPVLTALAQHDAIPTSTEPHGADYVLSGTLPAARVHALQQRLPGLTHGSGELVTEFDHYAPVRGDAPSRRRTDHDPLDREAYLLHVQRRV